MQTSSSVQLFPHPFSKAYWKQAASELKNTRMLVFAALMIALRMIFKQLYIPIAADLRINTSFIVNAMGAMVMGPVLAGLCAAITDTLGAILFPTGPYFFPFIFTEMAGSIVFALFLYRTRITARRVILCRFCINFFVNLVLQTPIMMWYYQLIMGKYYAPFDMLRIVKNLALFPIESLILIVLLRYIQPVLKRAGLPVGPVDDLQINKQTAATLVALFLVGALSVGGYAWLNYNNTSLSASYSAQERLQRNEELGGLMLARYPELDPADTVCIIESAYPRAFHPEITYTVALYQATLPEEDSDALLTELRGLSKSKAAAREELTFLLRETVVVVDGKIAENAPTN